MQDFKDCYRALRASGAGRIEAVIVTCRVGRCARRIFAGYYRDGAI